MQDAVSEARAGATGSDGAFVVFTHRPIRRQYVFALSIMGAVVAATLVAAPHARLPLANTEAFLPAYAAALAIVELLTFVLLLSAFRIERSGAILLLALGYLLSGLLVIPWVLAFPGAFPTLGLDRNIQSTAFIAATRRIGFPLFALGYALSRGRLASGAARFFPSTHPAGSAVAAVMGTVVAIVVLAFGDVPWLPALMLDSRTASPLWGYVPLVSILLYAAVLALLSLGRRTVLDLWLMVVVGTLGMEIVLLSYLSAGIRLSVGWWVGRCFGLASASVVLIVLLAETTAIYARLTHTLAVERRGRESRLTAFDAFSALIAHEINQPLASITTSGHAGLRWIARNEPDLAEARAAFDRIVADGHRAGDIVRGIRSMARGRPADQIPVEFNRLVEEAIARGRSEARINRISLEIVLADDLPLVLGDPIQLRLVIENLFSNAVESLGETVDQPRAVRLGTERGRDGTVCFEIADNGIGIELPDRDRIYHPFFTTKPNGMGLGLMFCQHVVEAHGGRLWAESNEPRGAVFRFTVPHADEGSLAATCTR